MQINEIKELAMLMNSAGLSDIELKIPGMEIKLKKQGAFVQMTSTPAVEETKEQVRIHIESKPEAKVTKALNGKEVKSPIVGTFYSSPSPDSPAYVKVGDTVKKGDVLCIIEAMKMMNEIEAELDGKIVEILVANESAVEFGQPLFLIEGV